MKTTFKIIVGLTVPVVLAAVASAQTIEYSGSTLWGRFHDLAVKDNYAVCANSSGLLVLDISRPEQVVETANYLSAGPSKEIIIHNDFAFAANEKSGLQVFDISDPLSAELLYESYDSIGVNLAITANRAFLYYQPHSPWGDLNKLKIFDISTPAQVHPLGTISLDFEPYTLTPVNDSLLAIGYMSSLYLYDISDPGNPEIVSQFVSPNSNRDILVIGNYGYVALGDSGLQVIDFSDAANPQIVARLPDNAGDYYGELAYTDGKLFILAINYVEYPRINVLIRVNIDDPLNPVLENRFELGYQARGLAADGDLAFIFNSDYYDYSNTLHLLDISNQQEPTEVGEYIVPTQVTGFSVSGNYLYSAVGILNIGISDLTDPQQPATILFDEPESNARNICVNDNHAYVYNYDYYDSLNELRIYELNAPQLPELRDVFTALGQVTAMYANSSLLILSENERTLRLLDISDPVNPSEISVLENCLSANTIYVSGNYIYLVNQALQVCDISDIQNPQVISTCSDLNINDISVRGNIVYVGTAYDGIYIWDFSNPYSPQTIAQIMLPYSLKAMELHDNLLFVGAGSRGLYTWDISDINNVRLLDSLDTPNSVISLKADDGYLYANDQNALLIFRINPTGIEEVSQTPAGFTLSPNYPNPFNARTTISYTLTEPAAVTLDICDILGRKVHSVSDGDQPAGEHHITFSAKDLTSGVYFYHLSAGDYNQTRKMTLIK